MKVVQVDMQLILQLLDFYGAFNFLPWFCLQLGRNTSMVYCKSTHTITLRTPHYQGFSEKHSQLL